MVSNIKYSCAASLGFERSGGAVIMVRSQSARISKGLVFRKAKALLTNFRLAGQFNRTLSNSGFFAPKVAASDATDKAPKWASFTGYIGLSLPLIACRANLVKVSRNLCRLSGKMSAMRIELTRHAHLVPVYCRDGEGS